MSELTTTIIAYILFGLLIFAVITGVLVTLAFLISITLSFDLLIDDAIKIVNKLLK